MYVAVSVQEQDFSIDRENRSLLERSEGAGAIANFVGVVRAPECDDPLIAMQLEHYSGMTERSIHDVIRRAEKRWPLLAASVIHRTGRLEAGEQIVYVGVVSAHRQAAFDGCAFIMDFLKTEAPFWKKEYFLSGDSGWVSARDDDQEALHKWHTTNQRDFKTGSHD